MPPKKPASTDAAAVLAEPSLLRQELVPLKEIIEHGHNHRLPSKQDEAEILHLVESIRSAGRILQPILVYRDVSGAFARVFGFRRCEAAKRLGWKVIPAQVLASIPSDSEVHHHRAIENLERKNLTPAEEALAVRELVEAHVPTSSGRQNAIDKAARELGRDVRWIEDRLCVVDRLTTRARDQLSAGMINFAQARELVKVANPRDQEKLLQWILESQKDGPPITVDELRGEIADLDRSLKDVAWDLSVEFAKKRPCVDCEFNKATNLTLFGITEKQAASDPVCTNGACFDLKKLKAGELQQKAAAEVKARLKSKELQVKDLGTIAVAREVAPAGMRPEAVQAFLKAATAKPSKAPAKMVRAKQSAKTAKSPELLQRQAALLKWSEAMRKWQEQLDKAICDATLEDPHKMLLALALTHSKLWQKRDTYPMPYGSYSFDDSQWAKAAAPAPEKAISPELSKLLTTSATYEGLKAIAEIATTYEVVHTRQCGPEFAGRLAQVFLGKESSAIKPAPVFEDFLPKELRPQNHQEDSAGDKNAPKNKAAAAADAGRGDFGSISWDTLRACRADDAISSKMHDAPTQFAGKLYVITGTGAGELDLTEVHPSGKGKNGRVIKCGVHSYVVGETRTVINVDGKPEWLDDRAPANDPKAKGNAYAAGDYVVITASKSVGEVMGYVPKNRNTVNVKLASGAVRPHFEAELRKATPDEAREFENARED